MVGLWGFVGGVVLLGEKGGKSFSYPHLRAGAIVIVQSFPSVLACWRWVFRCGCGLAWKWGALLGVFLVLFFSFSLS